MSSKAKKRKHENLSDDWPYDPRLTKDLLLAKKEIEDFKKGKIHLSSIDELLDKFEKEDGKKISENQNVEQYIK